jgi:hypothetical protein
LDIKERLLDERHPDTAIALNNVAGMLQAQGAPQFAMEHVSATLGMWSHAVLPLHVTMH